MLIMQRLHENDLVTELLHPELRLTLSHWSSENRRATRRRRTTACLLKAYWFIESVSCRRREGRVFERARVRRNDNAPPLPWWGMLRRVDLIQVATFPLGKVLFPERIPPFGEISFHPSRELVRRFHDLLAFSSLLASVPAL